MFGRPISTFYLGYPKIIHYAIVKISVHLYLTLLYLFMWLILHSNFHNQDCIFIPMSVFVDLCFSFTPNCVLWYWQWSFENSIIQYYIKKKRKKKAIIVSIHSLLGRNRIHIGWTVCELWQILEKKKELWLHRNDCGSPCDHILPKHAIPYRY